MSVRSCLTGLDEAPKAFFVKCDGTKMEPCTFHGDRENMMVCHGWSTFVFTSGTQRTHRDLSVVSGRKKPFLGFHADRFLSLTTVTNPLLLSVSTTLLSIRFTRFIRPSS